MSIDPRTDELREAFERSTSDAARKRASDRFWAELSRREPLVYSASRIKNIERALKRHDRNVTNILDRRRKR